MMEPSSSSTDDHLTRRRGAASEAQGGGSEGRGGGSGSTTIVIGDVNHRDDDKEREEHLSNDHEHKELPYYLDKPPTDHIVTANKRRWGFHPIQFLINLPGMVKYRIGVLLVFSAIFMYIYNMEEPEHIITYPKPKINLAAEDDLVALAAQDAQDAALYNGEETNHDPPNVDPEALKEDRNRLNQQIAKSRERVLRVLKRSAGAEPGATKTTYNTMRGASKEAARSVTRRQAYSEVVEPKKETEEVINKNEMGGSVTTAEEEQLDAIKDFAESETEEKDTLGEGAADESEEEEEEAEDDFGDDEEGDEEEESEHEAASGRREEVGEDTSSSKRARGSRKLQSLEDEEAQMNQAYMGATKSNYGHHKRVHIQKQLQENGWLKETISQLAHAMHQKGIGGVPTMNVDESGLTYPLRERKLQRLNEAVSEILTTNPHATEPH